MTQAKSRLREAKRRLQLGEIVLLLKTLGRTASLALTFLTIDFMVYCALPAYVKRDTTSAHLQTSLGRVTDIFPIKFSKGASSWPLSTIFIKLGNQSVTGTTSKALSSGEVVNVTYLIGKSGNVYIQDIQPTH